MLQHVNDLSAQPCGCDPGMRWTCDRHKAEKEAEYLGRLQQALVADHDEPGPFQPQILIPAAEQPRRANDPVTAQERKQRPLATGVLDYFPDALLEVAYTSWVGNEQHNPGTPVHWDRDKSRDEADALARHLVKRGTRDSDGVRHSAKVAWRALAMLQKEIEDERLLDAPGYGHGV
jgi:hypothetical protein